ncbi:hypothetical protein AB6A40_008709 [Gnathostoma spinigerum]|uniref:NADH dehydrogenase subunit 5 n=1 Tax=Gnathostoma spinigerum TaxID=75299 RepID=A0ABD6ER34_9BILA
MLFAIDKIIMDYYSIFEVMSTKYDIVFLIISLALFTLVSIVHIVTRAAFHPVYQSVILSICFGHSLSLLIISSFELVSFILQEEFLKEINTASSMGDRIIYFTGRI